MVTGRLSRDLRFNLWRSSAIGISEATCRVSTLTSTGQCLAGRIMYKTMVPLITATKRAALAYMAMGQ